MLPSALGRTPPELGAWVPRSRRSDWVLSLLLILHAVSPVAFPSQPTQAQGAIDTAEDRTLVLSPGTRVEREFVASEVHHYTFRLLAGQFLRLVIDQQGIDAVATVVAPDGLRIGAFDSRWYGPEPVSVLARSSGTYSLEVRALQRIAAQGRYAMLVQDLRKATPEDENLVAAESASTEAKQLVTQGTAESLRNALKSYEEILPLWRTAGDRHGVAQVLNTTGHVTWLLGDAKKALQCYEEALAMRRGLGDRWGEGETLHNIAAGYSALGQKQKALEYYNQALPIRRSLGDQLGLAFTLTNLGTVYFTLGENHKALEHYAQALPLWQAINHASGQASTLIGMAGIHTLFGEPQKARDCYSQALLLMEAAGDRRGRAYAVMYVGWSFAQLG